MAERRPEQASREGRLAGRAGPHRRAHDCVGTALCHTDQAQLGQSANPCPTSCPRAAELGLVLGGVSHVQGGAVDAHEPPAPVEGAKRLGACHGLIGLLEQQLELFHGVGHYVAFLR